MRERPDRRKKLGPERSSYVSDGIDQAQQNRSSMLDLLEQGLTDLPEAMGQLTQLQQLNLARNQLTLLPGSVGILTQLKGLLHVGNHLTAILDII